MTDLEAAQPWAVGATHDVVPVRGPRPVLVRAGIGVAFTAIAILCIPPARDVQAQRFFDRCTDESPWGSK